MRRQWILTVADERESAGKLAAEGATAPESLRQKDRFGFCDTLESARQSLGEPPKG
jgi:hypothetical protein